MGLSGCILEARKGSSHVLHYQLYPIALLTILVAVVFVLVHMVVNDAELVVQALNVISGYVAKHAELLDRDGELADGIGDVVAVEKEFLDAFAV